MAGKRSAAPIAGPCVVHKRVRRLTPLSLLPAFASPPSPDSPTSIMSNSPPDTPASTETDETRSQLASGSGRLPVSPSLPTLPIPPQQQSADQPFNQKATRVSGLPLFRQSDIVHRQPTADMSEAETDKLSFPAYLEYCLTAPSKAGERAYLFSDEQYCTLLNYLTSGDPRPGVTDYVRTNKLDSRWITWLNHQMDESTYSFMIMEYEGRTPAEMQ